MAENDSKAVADRLRFLANHVLDSVGSADIIRQYADELDPQPVKLELSRREAEILRALIEGGNQFSMTNRAAHADFAHQVGTITFDEREALLEALESVLD